MSSWTQPSQEHYVSNSLFTGGLSKSIEKDRRQNKNLQSRFNMNIINISDTNETENERLQGDIRQLHSDIQCLTETLPAMYNLIDRAEWRIHDHYVADRLSKLKEAVYDAEDLLDEFRWHETKVSVEGNAISVEPIIDFFNSVTQGSLSKVTDIQKRLNNFSGQLEKLGLLQANPWFEKSFRPETTSFPTEAKIFGRDVEKKLIGLLGVSTNNSAGHPRCKRKRSGASSSTGSQVGATIDNNEATITSVPVLPIVGIGGVGKTTLAQDICNHSEVKCHFHLIIWICVSDDFDVMRLTKQAIEQSGGKGSKYGNLNSLQSSLENSLKTRRFLIVLDDMWDENERDWKCFCAPFRNVHQGSMMLVTTRSPKVANVVRTMDPFPLEGLNEDVFQKFFKLCVFGSDSSNNYPELELIGEKILPMLKGSPLAAKTLGRLLGTSLDLAHWDGILKSHLWEHEQKETDILPALRLSYMYLPLHLKRCFSFCAVYPKGNKFIKEDLVEIWVAEGLVEHQPNIRLHHAGGQYFDELAHLSFFQKYPWSKGKYVIPDLMHDMAQLVSKDECFIVKDTKDIPKIPKNVRHLLVLKGGDVQCSDLLSLCKHRKLRTLLCDLSLKGETDNTVMEKWCTELLCMRVMVCSINEWGLPGSIGNMKLLRYLKILDSSRCKSLPSEICCLYNMQIFYAKKWKIDDIPSSFDTLINLKKYESASSEFHLRNSGREMIFRNLTYVTSLGVDRRANVKSISFHSYNSTDGTFLSLTDVRIEGCQNLSSVEQFLQPAYVPNIKKIEILSCSNLECVPTEKFRDLHFLETLDVSNCPKIKSSRCLFAPSLKELYLEKSGDLMNNIDCSSLTIFHLSSSYHCESIELQMWNLPSLKELRIARCGSLRIIRDSEPLSTDPFHSGATSRKGKFPLLTHLTICFCEELKTMDDLLCLPAIERIEIKNCGLQSLCLPVPANRLGGSSRLKDLEDSDRSSLDCQSGLLLLTHLAIRSCKELKTIDELSLPGIESIEISDCGLLLSLPTNGFGGFPRLMDLEISNCQSLNWQSGMLLPLSLQKLQLWNCGDFSPSFPSCLEMLTSLEELEICFCECIVSVPGHLWRNNLKSLKKLQFRNCPKLKSVGGPDAIAHIRDLWIDECPELKEIDDQQRHRGSIL